ncbi:YCF48-related protein, partial [candidate division KSB1 bacterium]
SVTSNYLRAVHCVDANTCWAVGDSGTILKTANGGTLWSTQTSGVTSTLWNVHFVDSSNGWAVGNSGVILYTTDGGSNWLRQRSGTTDLLKGIHFYDSDIGWIGGGTNGLLLKGVFGSSSSYPTNADSNVTFKATGSDDNGDTYYLAICKTDAISVGTPPTCTGGAWDVSSSAQTNEVEETLAYTTSGADAESNVWHAFVCDTNACSSSSQSSGNPGSPFAVDHIPQVDDVNIGDTAGNTASTLANQPDGNGITFTAVKSGAYGDNLNLTLTNNESIDCVAETAATLAALIAGSVPTYTLECDLDDSTQGGSGNPMTGTRLAAAITDGTTTVIDDEISAVAAGTGNTTMTAATYTLTGGANGNPTGTLEPDDDVYFNVGITDADTSPQDTIDLHVCATDSFSNGCATDQTICKITSVFPSSDAECHSGDGSGDAAITATYNGIPTTHGTKTVYVFIEDNHGSQGTYASGTQSRTYSVTDVAPELETTVGYYSGGVPTDPGVVAAGGNEVFTWDVRLRDNNGLADITAVKGVFFESVGTTNACSTNGGVASQDCYIDTDCDVSGVTPVNGAGCEIGEYTGACGDFTCSVNVYYNADAASTWDVNAKVSDDLRTDLVLADYETSERTINTNTGIDVVDVGGSALTAIDYSSVSIGGTSAIVQTYVGNAGNATADFTVQGIDMACDTGNTPNCTGDTIGQEYQKWHHNSSTFDWDTAESADAGPWILDDSSGAGDGGSGCVNKALAVRVDGASTTESNEFIYWKLRIPSGTKQGDYEGENTYAFIADGQCTGTQY